MKHANVHETTPRTYTRPGPLSPGQRSSPSTPSTADASTPNHSNWRSPPQAAEITAAAWDRLSESASSMPALRTQLFSVPSFNSAQPRPATLSHSTKTVLVQPYPHLGKQTLPGQAVAFPRSTSSASTCSVATAHSVRSMPFAPSTASTSLVVLTPSSTASLSPSASTPVRVNAQLPTTTYLPPSLQRPAMPASSSSALPQHGEWMVEMLRLFWPSIAEYIGTKFKTKFRAREIYIDAAIDTAVGRLTNTPMPLPPTGEWLNHLVSTLWPMMRAALDSKIKKQVLPDLRKKLPPFLQSIDIDPCTLGDKPPVVRSPIKVLKISEGWMDLQLDVDYNGNAELELELFGHKVGAKEIKFGMTLFMSFHGFSLRPPFFHGLSIYMCKPCDVGLKWGGMLELLNMNFVEDLVRTTVSSSLERMMLLPNRLAYAIASPAECNVLDMKRPRPQGCLQITLLEADGLVGNEYDLSTFYTGELSTDPFVTITVGAETWRSSTLWNVCNPKWDDTENTHLYVVDVPTLQHMHIHVYDDGLLQHLRTKVNVGNAESDEVARNLDLSILELLERRPGDRLEEEILVEKWIKLDSWWPGRGMGPDAEEFAGPGRSGESSKGGFLSRAAGWAKEKMQKRAHRQNSEMKERLLNANARVRLRAHWRHVGRGAPLEVASKQAAAPAPSRQATPSAVLPPASRAVTQAVVPAGVVAPPQVVRTLFPPMATHQQYRCVVQLPPAWPPPFPGQPCSQPLLRTRPGTAVLPPHRPQILYTPPSSRPGSAIIPARTPQMLLTPPARTPSSVIIPASAHAKTPMVFSVPPSAASAASVASAASSRGASVTVAPHAASHAKEDEASRCGDAEEQQWERWPAYILRVGIASLERIPHAADNKDTVYYATVDAFPVVLADGKEVAVTTEGVTVKTTKKRAPKEGSVAGLALTLEESELLARKVGLLLSNGVPMDVAADVLGIDEPSARKILGVSMTEKSGCRDVVFEETFLYFLNDPRCAELNIEVYSEVPKQKQQPCPIGSVKLKLDKVLQCENLFLDSRRTPLEGATAGRIDIQCQLWPVLRSGVPVQTLIERATASERQALAAQGRGVKMAVWVYLARDLRNTDLFGGKSDPYCVGQLMTGSKAKEVFKTQVIDDEPNPEWNFGPETVEWSGEASLRFEVFDKDLLRKGDKLGEAVLSREQCLRGLYTDLDLGEGNGTLRVKVAPFVGKEPATVAWTAPKAKPKVQVWVFSAEGLRAVNLFGGSSDPYVVCSLSPSKSFETHVINDCLKPRWDFGPKELTLGTESELKFEVRDKDMIGSSTLGTATLKREQCLAGFEGPLRLGKGNGSLRVKVQPLRPGPELAAITLSVSVLSAKELRNTDLIGQSDPYVKCKLGDRQVFQTKVVWNEPNPKWDHGPEVVQLEQERELTFEVYDKDLFQQGDLLGRAVLERHRCTAGFYGDLDLGPGNGTLRVHVLTLQGEQVPKAKHKQEPSWLAALSQCLPCSDVGHKVAQPEAVEAPVHGQP